MPGTEVTRRLAVARRDSKGEVELGLASRPGCTVDAGALRPIVLRGGAVSAGLDRFPVLASILAALLLMTAACERSAVQTSASVDAVAAASPYAPQDGVETPFQPVTARVRHSQMLTRHVRHRHAGPR